MTPDPEACGHTEQSRRAPSHLWVRHLLLHPTCSPCPRTYRISAYTAGNTKKAKGRVILALINMTPALSEKTGLSWLFPEYQPSRPAPYSSQLCPLRSITFRVGSWQLNTPPYLWLLVLGFPNDVLNLTLFAYYFPKDLSITVNYCLLSHITPLHFIHLPVLKAHNSYTATTTD